MLMKKEIVRLSCIGLIIMLYLPGTGQGYSDGIFYSSLNYAVRLGQLDGLVTFKELKQHGDYGVGGEHGLAGELVFLNGVAYSFSSDGKSNLTADTATLAFAAVKFFRAENRWTINRPLDRQQLQSFLDSILNTNLFAAVKVSGTFSSIRYKCYHPQQKPYTPTPEAPAKIFDSIHIKGTMVGFFTPKAAMVLNPNYHFHFINSYTTSGGHVDEYTVENVTVEVDYADALQVKLAPEAALKDIKFNEPLKAY
jgi:acetolactate decarboxylase